MTHHHFAVAPMMQWTDRHCRAFHRVLSKHALLYTEMVTADAVRFGDARHLIGWNPNDEGRVALQLGGSDPVALAEASTIAERDFGYDEVNLNVGCPSSRVQNGKFGACLMFEPSLVAECLAAMKAAVSVPVTVKHRLGVDDQDPHKTLFPFVETVAKAGITHFVVHARKAILRGLSPKENRDVPPLDYPLVYDLKRAFPHLTIILNGGLENIDRCTKCVGNLDGVMLGRAAYKRPALLGHVDRWMGDETAAIVTPEEAHRAHRDYVARELEAGTKLIAITSHMLGLFHGLPGARRFRHILSEEAVREGAGPDVIARAFAAVSLDAEQRAA